MGSVVFSQEEALTLVSGRGACGEVLGDCGELGEQVRGIKMSNIRAF